MNDMLNHYQLNIFLKEFLLNSFSFTKNNIISKISNGKPSSDVKIDEKKDIELYEKYLNYINCKIDNYLDAR